MMSLWKLGNVLGGHFFFIASVTLALRVQLSSSETTLQPFIEVFTGCGVSRFSMFGYRCFSHTEFRRHCNFSQYAYILHYFPYRIAFTMRIYPPRVPIYSCN